MADNLRERNKAMWVDRELDKCHDHTRDQWLKFACAFDIDRLKPIYKLVYRYYKGGKQKLVKIHTPIRGGYNVNWRVEFQTGSAMLHVPMPGSSSFFDEKIRTEVATMKMIKERTNIPVPHIYHWGYAADNPTGLGPFIIMDYIEHERDLGDLIRLQKKAGDDDDNTSPELDPNVPEDILLKVYRQMARILLQLSTLEMPFIGSPTMDEHSQIYQIASRPITQNMTDMLSLGGSPQCSLPAEGETYATSRDYYSALADMHMAHLAFQHNQAVEGPNDCRDKYVARQLFRRLAKQGAFLGPEETQQAFKFFCDDLRPSSVLLNKENEVVGVIDWEFSYFAPASFSHDPPWWLILGKGEFWEEGIDNHYQEFDKRVPLFLRAMELEEERMQQEAESEENNVEDSALSFYLEQLDLTDEPAKATPKLSHQMRKSWKSGRHYINYAAQKSWGFDLYFWRYIDERFFGTNSRGGFEDRLHLLSPSEHEKMEEFVERKIEQKNDEKLKEWDEDECRDYLRALLADC